MNKKLIKKLKISEYLTGKKKLRQTRKALYISIFNSKIFSSNFRKTKIDFTLLSNIKYS